MNRYAYHAVALVAGGLIVACGCAYLKLKPSLPSVLAPPAKELAKVDKETLNCKNVIVYRDTAKKKLGLPEAVKADSRQKVLAATQVPAQERPVTVSAILNTETGITSMYTRLDPLPWISWETKRELGIAYGFKDTGTTARVFAKYDLIQVKALRAGLLGTIDSDSGYFGGVSVSYRF